MFGKMPCSSSRELQLCLKHEIQRWPGESSLTQAQFCGLLGTHIHSGTRRSLNEVSSPGCILCGGSRAGFWPGLCRGLWTPLCGRWQLVLPRAKASLSSRNLPPAAEGSGTASSASLLCHSWACLVALRARRMQEPNTTAAPVLLQVGREKGLEMNLGALIHGTRGSSAARGSLGAGEKGPTGVAAAFPLRGWHREQGMQQGGISAPGALG